MPSLSLQIPWLGFPKEQDGPMWSVDLSHGTLESDEGVPGVLAGRTLQPSGDTMCSSPGKGKALYSRVEGFKAADTGCDCRWGLASPSPSGNKGSLQNECHCLQRSVKAVTGGAPSTSPRQRGRGSGQLLVIRGCQLSGWLAVTSLDLCQPWFLTFKTKQAGGEH